MEHSDTFITVPVCYIHITCHVIFFIDKKQFETLIKKLDTVRVATILETNEIIYIHSYASHFWIWSLVDDADKYFWIETY